MLRVDPEEYIKFKREDASEINIELSCISKYPVTYKIQTTSPEKFRVHPRCGVLSPGETAQVKLMIKPEQHLNEQQRDKFLVMSMAAPVGMNLSTQELNDFWKQKNDGDIEQHRLQCIYEGDNEIVGTSSKPKGTDLERYTKKLEKRLRLTQMLQCFTMIFVFILATAVGYLLKLQLKHSCENVDISINDAEVSNCPYRRNK